jgi:hypothetical protein
MRSKIKTMIGRAAAAAAFLAAPAAAQAQLFYTDPPFEGGTIEPGDPLVGEPLPGATPAEARAALIWNLRAGLNVGAIRCQNWKFLRAVDVYNGILAHHKDELAAAYATLGGYFKRVNGPREGQRRLDQWNTTTYQNFSTNNAQGFCQTASNIGKEALARPKGEFSLVARERLRELRNSTRPYVDTIYPIGSSLRPLSPAIFAGPVCTGLTGRALQQCQQGQAPR